jgi:N-acetylmuramic acid 6-phosphate etherase
MQQPDGAPLSGTERSTASDLGAMDAAAIAAAFVDATARLPQALASEQDALATAIDSVAKRMATGGRMVLVGAGTSGRLAHMEALEVGPTFGIDADSVIALVAERMDEVDPDDNEAIDAAEDDGPAAVRALDRLAVGSRDSVVGIAASGRTPFTLAALEAARTLGALTVSVACNHPSPMGALADIAIHPLLGPELLAGSTRLGAGTATKVILDALTTGVMVRLGHVYRDRMVDMRAGNAKLRDRAVGIVMDLTARPPEEARAALESVGWWCRAATIRLELGLAPAAAIERAERFAFLADALAADPDDRS